MIGVSTGLLAYGLMQSGQPWRLWLFASFPFWAGVQVVNWPALLLAAYYIPALWPLLVVKPHTAIPVAVSRWNWRGAGVALAICAVSLILRPGWPLEWLSHVQGYSGGPAVLRAGGPLLLLAGLRWRSERARYFLLCCLVPLRLWYDLLLLFVVPQRKEEMLIMVAASWLAWIANDPAYVWGVALLITLRADCKSTSNAG
jgi:hypothetical protein